MQQSIIEKKDPKTVSSCSICLPIYNEEDCLEKFLLSLFEQIDFCTKEFNITFEVIAVDDGSKDSSLDILNSFSTNENRLQIYSFEKNAGHQAAILCGLNHAKGDLIITMDSDGQDPPESISKLIITFLESGTEIIIAKRKTRRDGLFKKLSAWIFYRFVVLLGLPPESKDAGDFRLITNRVNKMLLSQPESLQYLRGQIFMLKIKIKMISIDRKQRIAGETKYTLSKMIKLAISSAFVIDPFKVSQIYISIAFLFSVISFLCGLIFVVTKLIAPYNYASGITTLALLMLILFTVVICMIAFQSLYMSLLFRSLRNEPIYLEKKIK